MDSKENENKVTLLESQLKEVKVIMYIIQYVYSETLSLQRLKAVEVFLF